jgi:hypothetical protein
MYVGYGITKKNENEKYHFLLCQRCQVKVISTNFNNNNQTWTVQSTVRLRSGIYKDELVLDTWLSHLAFVIFLFII